MGQVETFAYNTDGTLATKTDFNGNTATYSYDPVYKRLVGVNYSDGSSESYTYEPVSGRRLTATNSNGTTVYEYYPVTGRLFRETVPAGHSVEYQWDANGNKKAEIRPGETLFYTYDALGRISTIRRSGDNAVASYTYLPNGREHTFTDFNGNVKTNGFDSLGRLISTSTANMHGTPLGNYGYGLDAVGNRRETVENGVKIISHSYDELNRLTSETVTDMGNVIYQASYTYDPTGNRLTKTTLTDTISYSYDANDRVTLETVTDPEDLPLFSRAYTYDSNGNTLNDGTKTFSYDSKNRLISFTDAADTGIYTYDTAGRRLSKTYGGSTAEYLYCTTCRYAQVLEERDDLGNITAEYYIGNDLISREDGAQELSYLYDGHGSVRKLINEYGGVPAQYSYDAYGILLESSGPSSEDNDFRYSGEQFDPHLDQYYLRARYYNQNVGRFSSMDSWGGSASRPLSLNKYNYTESNPVMGRDPSGHFSVMEMIESFNVQKVFMMSSIAVIGGFIVGCSFVESNEILIAKNLAVEKLGVLETELSNNFFPSKLTNSLAMFFNSQLFDDKNNHVLIETTSKILERQYSAIKKGLETTTKKDFLVIKAKSIGQVYGRELPIHLTKSWFKLSFKTIPSRDGALVHEAAHIFLDVGDGGGYYDETINTASRSFYEALNNADNYRAMYDYWFRLSK